MAASACPDEVRLVLRLGGGECHCWADPAVRCSAVLDSLRRVQVRWVEAFQFPMAADGRYGMG